MKCGQSSLFEGNTPPEPVCVLFFTSPGSGLNPGLETGWLVGWLVGRLVGWLAGQLGGRIPSMPSISRLRMGHDLMLGIAGRIASITGLTRTRAAYWLCWQLRVDRGWFWGECGRVLGLFGVHLASAKGRYVGCGWEGFRLTLGRFWLGWEPALISQQTRSTLNCHQTKANRQ